MATRARCRPPSVRRQRQAALTARIREIHAASRETYGAPRVHAELHAQDVPCCRNTVAKLMREAQIVPRSVRRFRITTDSRNTQVSADLVQRRFEAQQPNQRWLSDVTYIPTREGWLYLAAVLDLYSRAVVGWAMSRTLGMLLVIDALSMVSGNVAAARQSCIRIKAAHTARRTTGRSSASTASGRACRGRATVGTTLRWKASSTH